MYSLSQVLDYLGLSRKDAMKMIQNPDIFEGLTVAAIGAAAIGTGAVSVTAGITQILWGTTVFAGGAAVRQGKLIGQEAFARGRPFIVAKLQRAYELMYPPAYYICEDEWEYLGDVHDSRVGNPRSITCSAPLEGSTSLFQHGSSLVIGTSSDNDSDTLMSLSDRD